MDCFSLPIIVLYLILKMVLLCALEIVYNTLEIAMCNLLKNIEEFIETFMKMYVFKNYGFSTPKFDFCSLVKKIINILKCLCKYYVRGIMAKPKTYIRQNGIRLLPHTTIQHLSVVVVHTHTLPFFPHPHVLFKCLLNPEKFKKKFDQYI